MAKLTFLGTSTEAVAALTAPLEADKIDANTKVTIKGNSYTLEDYIKCINLKR